jgi:hypothetical protein
VHVSFVADQLWSGQNIWLAVCMWAQESGGNYSAAQGCTTMPLYNAPPNTRISFVYNAQHMDIPFLHPHSATFDQYGGPGWIDYVYFTGFFGNDAMGGTMHVDVHFKEIDLTTIQTDNCK